MSSNSVDARNSPGKTSKESRCGASNGMRTSFRCRSILGARSASHTFLSMHPWALVHSLSAGFAVCERLGQKGWMILRSRSSGSGSERHFGKSETMQYQNSDRAHLQAKTWDEA